MDDNIKQYLNGDNIKLNINNTIEYMPLEEFSNWIALITGVEEVTTCAERLGIDVQKSDMWIKPIPLEKYVREKGNFYYNHLLSTIAK